MLSFLIMPAIAFALLTLLGVPEGVSAIASIVLGVVVAVKIVTSGWRRIDDSEQPAKAQKATKVLEIKAGEGVSKLLAIEAAEKSIEPPEIRTEESTWKVRRRAEGPGKASGTDTGPRQFGSARRRCNTSSRW